jgi:hypothetical protein
MSTSPGSYSGRDFDCLGAALPRKQKSNSHMADKVVVSALLANLGRITQNFPHEDENERARYRQRGHGYDRPN